MNKKHILILIFLLFTTTLIKAQSVYDDAKNHACLKCHASQIISFHNAILEKEQKKLMNPHYIIDTLGLKAGVHQNFDCTDCHSYEYSEYPHNGNLKLEPMNSCLDCHGGDPTYDTYQFDRINEEFQKSIHFKVSGENFSCGKCHDQHTYKPTARNSANVREIVDYSNGLCLSCHNDMNNYSLIAGKDNPEIVQVHNWLPNQELHFKNVRCIECHTDVVDSLMVSHNIMSKENAVRNCNECHSQDSRLKASLYKYENLQSRAEKGTVRAILSNESYVIGTQQFPVLRKLSFIIFFMTIGGILIHVFFRFIKK
jgi:predicted CXXCH cytochrome family protein